MCDNKIILYFTFNFCIRLQNNHDEFMSLLAGERFKRFGVRLKMKSRGLNFKKFMIGGLKDKFLVKY